MKLKDGYLLHESGRENLMIATGAAAAEFNGLVRSNDTAQFLLKCLQKNVSEQDLVQALLKEYDVDEATASRDVHGLVIKMMAEGFLDV